MGILGDLYGRGKKYVSDVAEAGTNAGVRTFDNSSVGRAINQLTGRAAESQEPTVPGYRPLPSDYGNLYEWFYHTLLVTSNSI